MVVIASVFLVCITMFYALVMSTVEPVMLHSTELAHGVKYIVGSAIAHANQQSERNAMKHYRAREEYMERRERRSRRLGTEPETLSAEWEETGRRRSNEIRGVAAVPIARPAARPAAKAVSNIPKANPHLKSGKSGVLLRMAALQQAASPINDIDDNVIHQYFPKWITNEQQRTGQWNQEAVLRDLVLAVSHLAHEASVDVHVEESGR